jgi:rubredoxin-NAD+ reductase
MLPIIVVGSGLAGYNFARQYRQLDQQRPVLIVSQDDASFYSKPALSTGMHKGKSAVGLITKEAENMAHELALDIRPFCNVTALNTSSKVISTNQGDFEYHQLILATGSLAIRPPMEGNATEKVYQVNNLSEYAAFRAAVVGAKRVVIIGAGLIGAEFCNDLALSGYQIDIIDPLPHMLGNLIPAAASQAVENAYQELGVNMHFSTTATRVDSQGRGYNVTLANGDVIECDAVLSAVGVRSNTAIASSAGLEVARGIVTNSLGQTSHPDIFALGDCAELGGQVRLYVAPLVSSAEAIAKTICGHATEITLPNTPVTIKTTHHPVVVVPVAREAEGEWIIDKSSTTGVAAKFVSSSGEVVGFALTGTSTAEKESYLAML